MNPIEQRMKLDSIAYQRGISPHDLVALAVKEWRAAGSPGTGVLLSVRWGTEDLEGAVAWWLARNAQ